MFIYVRTLQVNRIILIIVFIDYFLKENLAFYFSKLKNNIYKNLYIYIIYTSEYKAELR